MSRYSLSWYIFTFTLLELIIKTHLTIHDGSHGFISKNSRYFDDDLSNIREEITSSFRINDAPSSMKLQLKFEPSFLDFKLRPLGVPHMEKVTLFNIDNKSIDMTSISGNTVHFHSSFFEDKRVPPMGNTSFNVVFLGREEGFIESNLFIHTSEGHLKYNVKGASTYSHYRLRPIVGIKLPVNSTFSPLIYMHNPHSEPIQIVEIYSSGGGFHLELPSGEQEGPNDMWQIPPQHTKAIIRIRFQAKVVQNHTAYVRIKLNKPDEVLVVPLEVEVTPQFGIFHPQGSIDFGIGGNLDPPKTMPLCVQNPLKKPIRIHSVYSTSKAIQVQYDNVKIAPPTAASKLNKDSCVNVGSISLNWQKAYEEKEFSGKIVVKFRNGKSQSEIPYYVTVLKGGFSYDPLLTTYFINDKTTNVPPRKFKLRNEFAQPVHVLNATILDDAGQLFSIEGFIPRKLKAQEEANLFKLSLKPNVQLSDLSVNSQIILTTNVSNISVQLLSYNGKMQVILPFKSKDYSLDLGLISFDAKKEVHFLLLNENPVDIHLKSIRSSIPMTSAEYFGCGSDDYKLALFQVSFKNLTKCLRLKSNHYVVVKLVVQTSNAEGQIWGDIQIETQFENLSVPVHFKIAPGKLEIGPDRLVFDQCFPGKICSHPLRVHSTFNDPMVIEDIITLPPDKRIFAKHSGHILARATKVIGHLYLNPNIECGNECYAGMQHESTAQWLKTFDLNQHTAEFDTHLLNVFYNRYINLTSNGLKKWQNLTLRLDTSEVRGHLFKTRVKMSWPSLLLDQHNVDRLSRISVFVFPLTQVGNMTFRNVTIRNPSSYNLVIQLVLDKNYPSIDTLYDGLPSNFIPNNSNLPNGDSSRFFFNSSDFYLKEFRSLLLDDIEVSANSLPLLLMPGQNVTVTIGFRGEDTSVNSGLLFIRNNLTILEVVKLKGQGALPLFKFGNRKPGSTQPLSFEMTEKHLKDCERDRQSGTANLPPNLTVKRSFTARNIGDITIYVRSFYINDFPCEGYGFKVVNCQPFVLPPNGTRKIDIAFTPDLTLTKVTRTLILGTSLNIPVNYTLFTTIPSHYLSLCAELITRPNWENHLNYLTITLMFILFVMVVILAILEADVKVKNQEGLFVSPANASVQPVLDLRLVGQQTREEFRSQAKIETPSPTPSKCEVEKPKTDIKPAEKYTAIIPVTGRTKKNKLAKKNSIEADSEPPVVETASKKPGKKLDDRKTALKEAKAKSIGKKLQTKNTNVPVTTTTTMPYEEETSSTSSMTTESSSSNYEETEKENQRQMVKNCSRKTSNNNMNIHQNNNIVIKSVMKNTDELQTNESNNNINIKEKLVKNQVAEKVDKVEKIEKDKPEKKLKNYNRNSNNANHNNIKEEKEVNLRHRDNKKANKNKERKEKQHNKKMSFEKAAKSDSGSLSSVSPPIGVWGETRAKFSDVVARTDPNPVSLNLSSSTARPLAQTNHKSPSIDDSYKQTLGPIGTKRDFWQSSGTRNESSHSFFTNAQDLCLDNNRQTSGFVEDYNTPLELWNQRQNYMNLLDSADRSTDSPVVEDPWNPNLFSTNYWSSDFSPLLSDTLTNPPLINSGNNQSGYLWGNSSVWQPWSPPELPRTPTRSPPGFDEYLQRKREEQTIPETYNPFNTSPIWTSQQQQDDASGANLWTYSQNGNSSNGGPGNI